VHIFEGDCNEILLEEIFPQVRYEDYRRGLCLLDPYGLHLNWDVIETAGKIRTIDLFLNFPIMDINRNALWRYPEKVREDGIARMNAFWGDESWRDIAYEKRPTLFGDEDVKLGNEEVTAAFQKRMREKAGFRYVPTPMPMRNTRGAVVYYLYFASQQPSAHDIVTDIFKKYRNRGA
jgi:three-Cys-motif partner protein